mmetsp:Transcript_27892/g.64806  ORF Transcript_27892/g.64806 Transcript_27892/m.64806 type:complete len:225 (+) Transcript_27892:313-987(+)
MGATGQAAPSDGALAAGCMGAEVHELCGSSVTFMPFSALPLAFIIADFTLSAVWSSTTACSPSSATAASTMPKTPYCRKKVMISLSVTSLGSPLTFTKVVSEACSTIPLVGSARLDGIAVRMGSTARGFPSMDTPRACNIFSASFSVLNLTRAIGVPCLLGAICTSLMPVTPHVSSAILRVASVTLAAKFVALTTNSGFFLAGATTSGRPKGIPRDGRDHWRAG